MSFTKRTGVRVGDEYQTKMPQKMSYAERKEEESREYVFQREKEHHFLCRPMPDDFDFEAWRKKCRSLPMHLPRKRRRLHRLQSPRRLTERDYEDTPTTSAEEPTNSSPRWTINEDAKLLSLVTKCGLKFSQFTDALPRRSATGMRARYKKLQKILKQKMKRNLKEAGRRKIELCDHERLLLAHCIYKWGTNWDRVQEVFPERTADDLKAAWKEVKGNVHKWDASQNKSLRTLFLKYGCDVRKLFREYNRHAKQRVKKIDILCQLCNLNDIGINLDKKLASYIKEYYEDVSGEALMDSICTEFGIGKPRAGDAIRLHESILNFVVTDEQDS